MSEIRIKYKGMTAEPSDYSCNDGDMSVVLGGIAEDGEIKAIERATDVCQLPTGCRVVYEHKTTRYDHYIVVDDNGKLYWIPKSNMVGDVYKRPLVIPAFSTEAMYAIGDMVRYDNKIWRFKTYRLPGPWDEGDVDNVTNRLLLPVMYNSRAVSLVQVVVEGLTSVSAIGDTVVIAADGEGVYYTLWGAEEGTYLWLGSDMPEVRMHFGLKTKIVQTEPFEVTYDGDTILRSGRAVPVATDAGKKTLTNVVMAQVNKLVKDETDKNRFCMPFFVRYAYRLYDGSLTKQSAPILMLPTNGLTPTVIFISVFQANPVVALYQLMVPSSELTMEATYDDTAMEMWRDVIKSVDIYVSAPTYTYDQNGECGEVVDYVDESYGVFALDGIEDLYSGILLEKLSKYTRWYIKDAIHATYGMPYTFPMVLEMPESDRWKQRLGLESSFYYLTRVDTEKLSHSRQSVEISDKYLSTLVVHEALTDDYDSHDRLIAGNTYVYNGRMMLCGMKKELYNGYYEQTHEEAVLGNFVFADLGGVTGGGLVESVDEFALGTLVAVMTTIRRDGKNYIVEETPNVGISPVRATPYHYHPDPNAIESRLYIQSGSTLYKVTIPMAVHEMLTGAVHWTEFGALHRDTVSEIDEEASSNKTINIGNKLYTSEVDNPYVYGVSGIHTVGAGVIMSVAAATKAMSEGQHGRFPLYVMSSDGVYTMQVSDTGALVGSDFLTAEVCLGADRIAQIDNAVLICTERGVLMMSGSERGYITATLESESGEDLSVLPRIGDLGVAVPTMVSLRDYMSGAKLLYDYHHQRVWLYNTDKSYAYVYSLRSKMWGMMMSDIASTWNSYPDAMVMSGDGKVKSLSEPDGGTRSVLLITRPIKTQQKDMYKTIRTLLHRGVMRDGTIGVVLWASRDMNHWVLIGSSSSGRLRNMSGTGYKYYRIGVVGSMSSRDRISEVSLDMVFRGDVWR